VNIRMAGLQEAGHFVLCQQFADMGTGERKMQDDYPGSLPETNSRAAPKTSAE